MEWLPDRWLLRKKANGACKESCVRNAGWV
jgi:hypothetical protein